MNPRVSAADAVRAAQRLLEHALSALSTPTVAVEREPDGARPWWRPRHRWTVVADCGCSWSGWSWTADRAGRHGWQAYGDAIAHQHEESS